MKKISLILNAVLLVAVAILYYLHFSSQRSSVEAPAEAITSSIPSSIVSAAYVDLDTLLLNLDHYFDLNNKLKSKTQQSQNMLDNNAKNLQKSFEDLQTKASKGLITKSNYEQQSIELEQERQRVLKLREDLTYQLAEEEQVMNRSIMYEIMEFLKKYNTNKNYQMIISNNFGGTLLFANDSMNITKDVIKGLNAEYAKTKEKK